MPSLKIPAASASVSVSIIDTTSWASNLPCGNLFKPPMKGLTSFDICSYAFLVTHEDNNGRRSLLFDLGIRKDWQNMVPPMLKKFENWKADIKVEKDVADILTEGGVELEDVEAIILRFVQFRVMNIKC